jgi:hypothetical protein
METTGCFPSPGTHLYVHVHWLLLILLALLLATSSSCFHCHSVTFSFCWPIWISNWCIFLVQQYIFACLSLSSSITVTCSINNFCVWLGPAFLSWQLPQKPWVIPPSRAGLLPRPGVSFLGTLAWRTLGSYHYLYLSFTLFSLLPLDLDLNLILFARLGRVPVSCSLLFIDVIALFISDECPYWFLAFTLSSFYSFYYWLL